jgi:hypothetical protein
VRLLHRALQHAKLMPEGKDLKLQGHTASEHGQSGHEQCG